jgi:hypothetical protein
MFRPFRVDGPLGPIHVTDVVLPLNELKNTIMKMIN